jgi:3-methyladenine DNA glycosylase AlkD
MRKYMRDRFPFLGIKSPERRALQRAAAIAKPPASGALLALAQRLWSLEEREYQYAACDLLSRHIKLCGADDLPALRTLIVTKSWWDTVDALAADCVGALVDRFPALVEDMDRWVQDANTWVARTAILHQLRFRDRTDEERLFRYCRSQSGHPDFFIRKAIGWALRQYSWVAPVAVADFVAANRDVLSPLSQREALIVVSGKRGRARLRAAAG